MSEKSTMQEVTVTKTDEQNFTFTLNDNADCFCFYAYQKEKSTNDFSLQLTYAGTHYPQVQYNNFYAREVTDDNGITSAYTSSKENTSSPNIKRRIPFSLPIANGELSTLKGEWKGVITLGDTTSNLDLRCTERIKANNSPISRKLKIAPLLYVQSSTDEAVITKQETWIKRTYNKISGIYEQAGINCEFEELIKATYQDKNDYLSLQKLTEKYGSSDTILIIFSVHRKLSSRKTVLGVAQNIPGPQGLSDKFSSILINMENGPNDALVQNSDHFAHTIAHEVAHILGLTHQSANDNSQNLAYGYVNKDVAPGNKLTEEQIYILQHMPIVEVEYADPNTPITELEIVIKTGTKSHSLFDNGGTSMRVQFGLGTDEKTKKRWALDNGNSNYYFDAGETATFKITNIKDLYLDNITMWNITCNWNEASFYPLNFLFVDDAWDFQHIKVTANSNLVLVDATINTVLSWAEGKKFIKGNITK